MARPLRIEFAGALYHVTARGDRQEAIYEDDEDHESFLDILGDVVEVWNWVCHAFCQMTNHYHLVIETPDGNLSKGMRQLNGVYTQYSNRRHRRVGHLFQGRYKAILVDGDAYFLELSRYVVLNPVRARMVAEPGEWPWSSYNAMLGKEFCPSWLATEGMLAQFSDKRMIARRRYNRFVSDGVGGESIWQDLNRQIFLGDDAFVEKMQAQLKGELENVNIPRAHRRPPAPALEVIEGEQGDRDRTIVTAYETGEYSYEQIAAYFGLHFTTVGRVVRLARRERKTM